MKLRIKNSRKIKNLRKIKNSRKQNKSNKKNYRKTSIKGRGTTLRPSTIKTMANTGKSLSKKLLSVGEDVVTEVSKDQLKQLPKNSKTAIFLTQKTYNPNKYETANINKSNPQPIDFKYSPKNDQIIINEFELENIPPEQTPLKSIKNETQVGTPVKEEYIRPGSIFLHKADITQVKKNLFQDD